MARARSEAGAHRMRHGRTLMTVTASLVGALLMALFSARRPSPLEASPRLTADSLTFTADVAPILYHNCVMCHRPGGIAPFSMLDFDTVTGRLKDMTDVLREGKMPPWQAVAPPGTFRNERHISDADKRTILRWIAEGARYGNAAQLPPAPTFASD